MYLAEIGKVVRERLLKVPGIYHVPASNLEMFVVRNFLTPEECAGLIAMIDRDGGHRACSDHCRIRNSGPARAAIWPPPIRWSPPWRRRLAR
jgi:hypothetical protein